MERGFRVHGEWGVNLFRENIVYAFTSFLYHIDSAQVSKLG